jgi:hypothetical protein
MKEIILNALKYPISDWKKMLILGIIVVLSNIIRINPLIGSTDYIIITLGLFGLIISFLARGYQYRIIKSSISKDITLPDFTSWKEMFIDGVKVFLVSTVYLIPAILIILIVSASYTEIVGLIIPNLSSVIAGTLFGGGIIAMINTGTMVEIWYLIAFLYMIIILPVSLLAIAIMADKNGQIRTAFYPSMLLGKIKTLGPINLIKWYFITGILFFVLYLIGGILTNILVSIQPIIGIAFQLLIVVPYLYIFLYRSVGMFYIETKSKK